MKEMREKSLIFSNEINFNDIDSSYLKKFRKEKNISQKTLAKIIGVSETTVQKWEQGVNPIKGTANKLLYLLSSDETLIYKLQKKLKGNNL